MSMGLNTLSSKWPLEPPTLMATWLPSTCGWVGGGWNAGGWVECACMRGKQCGERARACDAAAPRRTCAQTMVMASHCVGLTLPAPWQVGGAQHSFSGTCQARLHPACALRQPAQQGRAGRWGQGRAGHAVGAAPLPPLQAPAAPGMMELPGSFSGRDSSPRPQRGPDPRNRMSLATFISDTAICGGACDVRVNEGERRLIDRPP